MRIIREARVPILAICFAHTLAAKTFGGKVGRNSESSERNRSIEISTISGDEFLEGNYVVDVNHRDYVSPRDGVTMKHFNIRAVSADENRVRTRYVQYMRHKSLPIFSVQFHPETHLAMPEGYEERGNQTFARAKADGERMLGRFLELALEERAEPCSRGDELQL